MSKDDAGEKKHAPSAKKLKDARAQGQVARTPDASAWVGIGTGGAVLPLLLDRFRTGFAERFQVILRTISTPDPHVTEQVLAQALKDVVATVLPFSALLLVVAIGINAAQGGIYLATKAAKPKVEKLNVLKGLKRLFSKKTLWEGLKTLVKTLVVGTVLWQTMRGVTPLLVTAGQLPLAAVLEAVSDGTTGLIRSAVAAGLVIAAADYVVARRRNLKDLRMTDKEVRDEQKQTEGDPMLKGQRRSRALAMSRNRMMSEVSKADAVLVNPTHVAVALRYEPEKGAPRVVAKGGDALAAKIRAKASEHRVPMIENVGLARALYFSCEVGAEIPLELYTAVAQVLAFVMRLRTRGASSGMHRLQVNGIPADAMKRRPRRRRRTPERTA